MFRRKAFIEFRLDVFLEEDGKEFHAFCPALKGLHVGGLTEDEAVENAKESAIAYIESLIKHHEPIPVGYALCEKIVSIKGKSHRTEDLQVVCAI